MSFKKIIGKIHLWLGLVSGVVVFVISLTGCLYAFQEEIQNLTQSYRFVEPQSKPFLPPSVLKSIAEKQLPDKHLHAVLYMDRGKAAQVSFFHFEPSYYYIVYLNPYDGKVLKVKDMDSDFFRIVLQGHFYFWLPPAIGQPFVAYSTLVFVVLLVTGIVLWWPKNKAAAKQRFWFNWKQNLKWKRKNYDLHNILGFYASIFILILALTGLVWGFQWFAESVYGLAGGKKSLLFTEPISAPKPENLALNSPAIDQIWHRMQAEYPKAAVLEVHVPESDTSAIAASANPDAGTYWKTDYRYFDQYSLKEIKVGHLYGRFEEASAADKLLRMNYDLHVGAVGGLAGKVLAFLVSLVATSLPVTGFLIWWGRRKKVPKKVLEPAKAAKTSGGRLILKS